MTPSLAPVCKAQKKQRVSVSLAHAVTFPKDRDVASRVAHNANLHVHSGQGVDLRIRRSPSRRKLRKLPKPLRLTYELHPLSSQATHTSGNEDTEQGLPDTQGSYSAQISKVGTP